MHRNRIIPCLLRHKSGIVKTEKFTKPRYIGDPLNTARLYNEKEVDELIVLDIDATVDGKEPDYQFIEDIASECFMPVCYGGGIKTIEQMRTIFSLGIEKVALSSVLIDNPQILTEAASIFGRQSLVAVLDVKQPLWGAQRVYTHNGKKKTTHTPIELAQKLVKLGAGEIVINNIDNDGTMRGYDYSLMAKIAKSISVPVVALGGASELIDMVRVVKQSGCSAAAAGSLFVYSGKHRAVLVTYPKRTDIDEQMRSAT